VSFGRPGSEEGEPLARKEPIVIDLGGGLKFRLAGQIDRIDQIGDASFEVIDYKTGGYWEKDWAGITSGGRKLQHALYGLAAAEILKQTVKGPKVTKGTYYFTSARGGQERRTIDAMSTARLTSVLSDLRQVIASGLFVHAPEEDGCKWCDFGNACGSKAQPRAAIKMSGDAGLEPYRKLAAHE
jgi:ATP-dependent helicase/nuclease subunit B